MGSPAEAPTRTSAPSALPTELASPVSSPISSSSVDQGRFLPGTMLADRYRIIGLLGRGGMGEVYRADDLKLGQPVALKFLPRDVERDEGRLQRFLNEVRMALKVTHSNVTRVHDIGEEDGHHYISMEYVDGEDLASLLRRIGRLPKDKAVQVARQICAGLAAAHDQGVLHRDLKPANVMLDGRGQVKITDFGLAGLDETIKGAEARAGTPAYMAPEQWAGDEVTVRSDLYALGLVLYELFSGESVFADKTPAEILKIQQEASSSVTSPSTVIEDIDPAVERVILECLEKDPARRPRSALAVSAALPGGDPLAAALAAGETPSPELVAQAGQTAGLSPRAAALCLVALVAGLAFWVTLGNRQQLTGYLPPAESPQYLAGRARQIVKDAGYAAEPADSLWTYTTNDDYLDHLRDSNDKPGHWEVLRTGQPASALFVYRESPNPIMRWSQGQLNRADSDPPMDLPGMIRLKLDLQGRLTSFEAVPHRREDVAERRDTTLDWTPLLEAAGLDSAELEPIGPSWAPPVFADVRNAWTGVYPDSPETTIRVEAAAFQGKPVWFQILEPWSHPEEVWIPGLFGGGGILGPLIFVSVVALAGWVGWRNVRLGRGDRSTAIRLAVFLGAVRLVWLLGAHHVPNAKEINLLMAHLAWAAWRVCLITIFYLAVEPYVRKLWPQVLTSWVRLFGGELRDPLVGRDLLLGVLFGMALNLVSSAGSWLLPQVLGVPAGEPFVGWGLLEALRGGPHLVAVAAAALSDSVLNALMPFIILLVVFRLLFRQTWLAIAAVSIVTTLVFWPMDTASYLPFLLTMPATLFLFIVVLFRFGFLAWVTMMFARFLLGGMPATFSPSDWYFGSAVFVVVLLAVLGVYGARTALAGRALFRDELLTDGGTPT